MDYDHPSNRPYTVRSTPPAIHQQNPSTNDAQAIYLLRLVEELKDTNQSKSDTITLLKIRVAVLESELKRALEDKDGANNSLSTLLETFARVTSNQHRSNLNTPRLEDRRRRDAVENEIKTLKDQESEIESLRKTIKRQARELKEKSGGQNRGRSRSPIRQDFGDKQPPIPSSHPGFNRPFNGKRLSFHPKDMQPVSRNNNPNDPPPFFPQSHERGESFETITTIPQSPAQPGVLPQDTEFTSLDDLFYDTEDEEAHEKKRVREKYFRTAPTPGVFQTGIVAQGKYLGKDSEFPRAEQPLAGRWLKDYNRQAPPPPVPRFGSDLTIASAISGPDASLESRLWNSPHEREYAIDEHFNSTAGEKRRYPDLFKYGIQFRPSEKDSNFLRSITISNIPVDIELRDVLSRVRGGAIVNSVMCSTIRHSLTGTKTAFITFLTGSAVTNYINHTTIHPLIFFSDSSTLPSTAFITRIQTPTYPNTSHLPSHPSRTRCLQVHDFPLYESLSYLQKLLGGNNAHRRSNLLDIWMDEHRSVFLHFSGMAAAGSAYACLISWKQYRGLRVHFCPDPCAGDVAELLGDIKPVPRLRNSSSLGSGSGSSDQEERYARERELENHRRLSDQDRIEREVGPRRQLAALTGQKVEIPALDGKGIDGANWADEVNEGYEVNSPPGDTSPLSESGEKLQSSVINNEKKIEISTEQPSSISLLPNLNCLMSDPMHEVWRDRKLPTGLEGSKYNTHLLGFEDRGRKLRRSNSPEFQSQSIGAGVDADVVNRTPREIRHHRAHVVVESDRPAAVEFENRVEDEVVKFMSAVESREGSSEEGEEKEVPSGDDTVVELKRKKKAKERLVTEATPVSHSYASVSSTPPTQKAEASLKETEKENPDEIDLDSDSDAGSDIDSESDLEEGEITE